MPNQRSTSLDLSRFIAALIVFTGHLFFLPSYLNNSKMTLVILNPIKTGDTAVMYFFALSGYVLTLGRSNQGYLRWTGKRVMRLYPVYLSAWLFGLIAYLANSTSLPRIKVLMLGMFGLQSFDPETALVVNAPLWSLSVEIVFAFGLYWLIRMRARPLLLFVLIFFSVILWSIYPWSPIFRAAPFFIAGIFLSTDSIKRLKTNTTMITILIWIFAFTYLSVGATWILALPSSVSGELAKLAIICTSIFLISRVNLTDTAGKIANALGERSFCIYAFHYPILLAANFLIQPESTLDFFGYIVLAVLFSTVVTELAFRLIDKPSTRFSRNLFA